MFTLALNGTLTSKLAAHVPVVRRWRIVWERRELGTRIYRIDREIPLRFADWNGLPSGGQEIPIVGDWSLRIKRVLGGGDADRLIALQILWNGAEVPGTYQTVPIPGRDVLGPDRRFHWRTELWRGVALDVAAVRWAP